MEENITTISTINFIFEEKRNGKYVETFRCDDSLRVYEALSNELIAKKLNNCRYIRQITRKNLYNGFQQITVSYTAECGGRRIYTVKN